MEQRWIDNLNAYVQPSGSITVVNLGARSEKFTGSGGSLTNTEGTGSTLTLSSGQYTYTASDGTKLLFLTTFPTKSRVRCAVPRKAQDAVSEQQ